MSIPGIKSLGAHVIVPELHELYSLTCPPVNIKPRYNIAPTAFVSSRSPRRMNRSLHRIAHA